mmetsp:Transcript_2662/g.3622  ORF Transcript_2662/g.3622 Transcript_2662/m.3622 type:complete len:200 (+) Transcript_2662:1335-1934(+)
MASKARRVSASEVHLYTPWLPAERRGFRIHWLMPSRRTKAEASSAVVATTCLMPRRPAALTASAMAHLSRRASLWASPLEGNPSCSCSASQSSTPLSQPTRQAATGAPRPAASCRTLAATAAASATSSPEAGSSNSARKSRSQSPMPSTALAALVHTAATSSPRPSSFSASTRPVEIGSTTTATRAPRTAKRSCSKARR